MPPLPASNPGQASEAETLSSQGTDMDSGDYPLGDRPGLDLQGERAARTCAEAAGPAAPSLPTPYPLLPPLAPAEITRALNALHVFDRALDFEALQVVLDAGFKYYGYLG